MEAFFYAVISATVDRYEGSRVVVISRRGAKKASFMFSLAFDLFVHNIVQLSNLFLKDLEKLREFTETYHKHKLLSLS